LHEKFLLELKIGVQQWSIGVVDSRITGILIFSPPLQRSITPSFPSHAANRTCAGFNAPYFALLAVISNDSAIFSIPSSLWVIIGSILILFWAIKRAARTICFGVANSGGNIYVTLFALR